MVQGAVGRRPVQIEGAPRLGREDPVERFGRQVGQQAVVEGAREVEHALQGPLQRLDTPLDVLLEGDVPRNDVDLDRFGEVPQSARLADPVVAAAALRIPVHQRDVARAGCRQVGQEQPAESAERPGDQVRRLRVEIRAQIHDREAFAARVPRRLQDQLSGVPAGGHQAQRRRVVAVAEAGHRQGRHGAPLQQVHALLRELARQFRIVAHQTVDVDRREAQVLAENTELKRVVGVDVHLADLAVPPSGLERFQAKREVVAGERIQDHLDAFAAGRLHHPVVPIETVGIECRAHTEREQLFALALASRRGVNLGARVFGQGDRGLADASHGRVDQHPLARAQAGEMHEGVVRRDVDRKRRSGLFQAQGLGFPEHQVVPDHHAVGDTAALREGHLVTDTAGADRAPHAAHDPARFHPHRTTQGRAFIGERRQHPQRHHDVAEIEGRCGNLDLHVARSEGGGLVGLHLQPADLARIVERQPVGGLLARGDEWRTLADREEARRPHPVAADRQLPLPQVALAEPPQRRQVFDVADIHEPQIHRGLRTEVGGDLMSETADGSPDRARPRLRHIHHRPARHHGHAAGAPRVLHAEGDQRLEEGHQARHERLPGRVLGIGAAEDVDRPQVGRSRPLREGTDTIVLQFPVRNADRLGVVQPGLPLRGRAVRRADDPPGSGQRTRVLGVRDGVPRPQQGRAPAGVHRGPGAVRLHGPAVAMNHQRQTAGDREPPEQAPLLRSERRGVLVQPQHLGSVRPQETRVEIRRRLRGEIQGNEAQGGLAALEGLVVGPGVLLRLADHPELGVRGVAVQGVQALVQDGFLRRAAARELDDVAGAAIASGPFQRGDQGRGLELAVRPNLRQRRFGSNELGLPGDDVLAAGQVVPARVRVERDVGVDARHQIARVGVIEADAAPGALPAPLGELSQFVDVRPVLFLLHVTRQPRPGRRAQEGHSLGAPRHGEDVRRP